MPLDESGGLPSHKLFVCCFDFVEDDDLATPEHGGAGEGTFQLVVEARDLTEAMAKARARLHEIAATTGTLGAVLVYTNAFVEVAPGDVARGVVVNHQELGDVRSYRYLPEQGAAGSAEHILPLREDVAPVSGEADADVGDVVDADPGAAGDGDEEGRLVPVFWARWKLYWCTTDDHDEDWFVTARSAAEAAAFHEDKEGYAPGDASAELICVLPDAAQLDVERRGGGWPRDETLLACGAELVPFTPRDGLDELRKQMGSGARVVRLRGRLFAEGDVVANSALHRREDRDA